MSRVMQRGMKYSKVAIRYRYGDYVVEQLVCGHETTTPISKPL